jgi:GNAT superfamily N-acetyltransferase
MVDPKLFTVRPMTPDDLSQALTLSTAEGWNQTEKDWRLLLDNPDNICIVVEKDNKVAGTATALVHSGKVAWIGMVIVDKAYRGQGAGRILMTQIIKKLKHIASIKLDATPAGQPLYKSFGFIDEYAIFRMTNLSLGPSGYVPAIDVPEKIIADVPADGVSEDGVSSNSVVSDGVTTDDVSSYSMASDGVTSHNMIENIFSLDEKIFGADRRYLLGKLIEDYPEKAFMVRNRSILKGYILGRAGTRFNYTGPLCADSFETARSLMSESLKPLIGKPVALDVPEGRTEFIKWLESAGFIKQRHFIRMYLNKNPYPGISGLQYLISGPEYG